MRKLIAVIGGHEANTMADAMDMAEMAGEELGRRGYGVVCGGGDGIMEAACRGCRRGGGLTIGILKGNDPTEGNRELDFAIPTSLDVASNNIVIWAGLGVLAFPGRYGTLNEIALALDFGKPIVALGRLSLLVPEAISARNFRHLLDATVVEAVDALEDLIESAPVIELRGFVDRAGAWIR
jgi:uncharacterized protein (TIGR00725 family)